MKNNHKCRRNSILKIIFSEKIQVYQVTPKWPQTLQGQRSPICVVLTPLSSKFHPIWLFQNSHRYLFVKIVTGNAYKIGKKTIITVEDSTLKFVFSSHT